jgi:hypothetical protein
MVDYLPRSAWMAEPAGDGPGPLDPSKVKGVVVHWPGSGETDSFDGRAEIVAALRGWQRFHMEDKGWSDIAYQVAVDQAGRAWILRGLRTQSGANGNEDLNERYGAILLVLVAGEEPSAAMKATVREVVRDFRAIYGDDAALILPHSAVRPDGTDCPGPKARAAIARGDFEPWADHPEPPEDDMWTPEQAAAVEKRYVLADQLWRAQTAAETAVSNALAARLLAAGKTPAEALIEVEKIWKPVQQALKTELEDA